jgi:hypothetical protein
MKTLLMVAIAAIPLLSGCNPDTAFTAQSQSQNNTTSPPGTPPGTPPTTPPVTPTGTPQDVAMSFNVPAAGAPSKVDVLFIVDNSGSMAGEQSILASSFSSFINQFQMRNVDFQVGVITTDVVTTVKEEWAAILPGYINPLKGQLLTRYAGERFLTNSTANLTSKFSANASVGTSGNGQEQALKSLELFLDPVKLAGPNAGFIRPDALLSVIVVSDEDENEQFFTDTVDGRIDRVVNKVKAIKTSASRGYRFDFLVNLNAPKPATIPGPTDPITRATGEDFYPAVYLRAAEKTSSRTLDVETNFGSDLVSIGGDIATQGQSEFKLSATPIAGTLVVKLNGAVIPADATNGYVYHADRTTIELRGSALAASPGGTLSVTFQTQ